jgi:hypothetical protein
MSAVIIALLLTLAMTFEPIRTPCVRAAQAAARALRKQRQKPEPAGVPEGPGALEARVEELVAASLLARAAHGSPAAASSREADLAQVCQSGALGRGRS